MAERTTPSVRPEQTVTARKETRAQERDISPPVDIYENANGLMVMADLPGVTKDGLDVRVEQGILTMVAKTAHVAVGTPVWSEFELSHFFRQFELPGEVDEERIKADLKHGILALHLPKKEKAKPRKIQVSVS